MDIRNNTTNSTELELGLAYTKKVIPDHLAVILEVANYVFVCTIIGVFGAVANVINMIIFYKQGLDNTVNISLFALAISDFCSLVILQWLNVCANPLFYNSGVPIQYREMLFLTAGWPQKCFARITSYITIYITAERLLCILIPLKVKQIITPKRTTFIIASIYVIIIATAIPSYNVYYLDWKFYPERNRTLIGMVSRGDNTGTAQVPFIIQAVLGGVSFPVLILLTSILVWKLKQTRRWRRAVTSDTGKAETAIKRDRRTVTMITLIAIVMIICYTPGVILFAVNFFIPEINVTGQYSNTFMVTWSYAFISESVNSSINIFLYYRMSSNYRRTFCKLFYCCLKKKKDGNSERNAQNNTTTALQTDISCIATSQSITGIY